jgi:hypothetical protein
MVKLQLFYISGGEFTNRCLGVDYTCVLDVRFTVECVLNVIFIVENSKMTLKTHATVKRTYKLHIQNARVINPFPSKSDALIPALF